MSTLKLSATTRWAPRADLGRFVEVKINPAARTAVEQSNAIVVAEAKRLCPVDTGELQNSIMSSVTEADKTIVGEIAATAPYAVYVEYGTGIRGAGSAGAGPGPYSATWAGMVAQPFMRPALDAARKAVMDSFASNIAVALRP